MNGFYAALKALAIAVGLGALSASVHGEVVISEILYEAQGADRGEVRGRPYNREWVELYNAGEAAVDVAGWQFGAVEADAWSSPLPEGATIEPKQALVVTGDAVTFDADWGNGINRVEVQSFPTMPSEPQAPSKTVAIRDAAGVVRDQVNYGAPGWPKAVGGDGHSVFALPTGLSAEANDHGAHWRPASQGVYGARFVGAYGPSENHGSPGVVVSEPQAPFVPSSDAAWSLAILPDTQNYVRSLADLPGLFAQVEWIKDRKDDFNIQVVLHEGDIVNQNGGEAHRSEQTADQQWTNARRAMSVLDGVVPYVMATGNHDYGVHNAESRTTKFNDHFRTADNSLVDPARGGILQGLMKPGELENAYYELQVPDGRQLLIIALEFWPRRCAVDWANEIAARPHYASHTAVLLTHAYMNSNERRIDVGPHAYGMGPDGFDGEDLWRELVSKHANFAMTLNGHVGGDQVAYLKSVGKHRNEVHQMLFNSQFEAAGGNGWLRIVEFLKDGKTVRVRTYSPLLDVYRNDEANSFEFSIPPLQARSPRGQASAAAASRAGLKRKPASAAAAGL